MKTPVCLNPDEIFHVHTWRCGHAGEEREEVYVQEAIRLGAQQITFTDHAPFPGDQFHGRMKLCELPEYEETLWDLKEKYRGRIQIRVGLEIEYLPGYQQYYEQLKGDERIEFLMLGQHFYELQQGVYSFSAKNMPGRADGILRAEIAGVESGYFSCVAHPDRGYRYLKNGEKSDAALAKELIAAAKAHQIPLERNISSMEKNWFYQERFWDFCDADYLVGLDAHSVAEMTKRYRYMIFFDR